ncbi:hypothetical protein [Acidithiobacillus sp.]|uniref:hypothetical protein n=1 Tax=Acidithiobacillus sp. TaxID=1872118 RepID=UPI003D077C3E
MATICSTSGDEQACLHQSTLIKQSNLRIVKPIAQLHEEPWHNFFDIALPEQLHGLRAMRIDGIALQFAHEPALWAYFAQGNQPLIDAVILFVTTNVAHNNGSAILVFNEAECFSSTTEINGKFTLIQSISGQIQLVANALFVEFAGVIQVLEMAGEASSR